MVQIMCWLDSEDYWNLHNMHENNQTIDYYVYRFNVEDSSEAPDPTPVSVLVVEMVNANLAIGFALSPHVKIEKEFQVGFICQERPDKDIPLVCKISDEVKTAKYAGTDVHRFEYIGFSLEKFYENKGAKFYLHDLRPKKRM